MAQLWGMPHRRTPRVVRRALRWSGLELCAAEACDGLDLVLRLGRQPDLPSLVGVSSAVSSKWLGDCRHRSSALVTQNSSGSQVGDDGLYGPHS